MENMDLITSIRVSEDTKRALAMIGGELTAKDGLERSMEDILKILVSCYKKHRTDCQVMGNIISK